MKVAFLYFDHIHHVFHNVTIAIELSKLLGEKGRVELLTTTNDNLDLLQRICNDSTGHTCSVRLLEATLAHRLFFKYRRSFPRKSRILKKHRAILQEFDAVVSADFTCGKLRNYLHEKSPKLIFTGHGAGDRNYGYRDDIKRYDFVLVAGEKVRQRLEEPGILDICDYAITGYAKFDNQASRYKVVGEIFPQTSDRKTVLYNPHFAAHLGSWTAMGERVLDYFCSSDKYNLIFAPHIMLFDPRLKNTIQSRWKNLPHIHIDTGSLACVDMSYTRLSDIYIGDVSSQVYEFLINPGYCIFLNAHEIKWKNNESFLNWTVGDVLCDDENFVRNLDGLLENSQKNQQRYKEKQIALIRHTFFLDNAKSASLLSAEAIVDFLEQDPTKHKRCGLKPGEF